MARKAHTGPTERQAYGLRVPRSSHPRLRRLRARHQPAQQGWRLWSATWLLLSHLEERDLAGRQVLDIGCGWGLASAYCARRGARVTAADVDPEVLPLARFHAQLNGVEVTTVEAGFADIAAAPLEHADDLIGADICFRADLIEPLFELLCRARDAHVAVALADPGRPPFLDLSARCVDELRAHAGRASTPEPLVAWPGERPLVHGRLLTIGVEPAA